MINIIQVGLGPLGQKVVQYASEREGVNVVAAVDPASDKAGRDLGELCGGKHLGVTVKADFDEAIREKDIQVAILTTVSRLDVLEPQVRRAAEAGIHVVSTCEELSFPFKTQPETARRIDAVFRENSVACVGTGVNPGFLMDYLPCVMTSVCQKVEKVRVYRVQDASSRRIPFQQKIGAGLTSEQFQEKVKAGVLRHVGLPESVYMIAHSVGWELDKVTETLEPVIAHGDITTGYTRIKQGMACGVEQIGKGFLEGREVIRLHFRAAVGEPESYDTIVIDGTPDLKSTVEGGVNGDIATCAITLNAVRAILKASPGLKTMLDLPVSGCF